MSSVEVPSFDEFYRSVHGREPFPWQSRLAAHVAERGVWPTEIGVPTGLGKTSAIDIAVWSLAAQAGRAPAERTAPTRIWYVVDRRLLVDAASEHASRLAGLLADPTAVPEVLAVAAALCCIGAIDRPDAALFVSRLRGGAHLGLRPPDPAQPSVICSTVAMYASRLLFRGYGSSTSMRPIDAALAGIDALVLLDEAHLALPLRDLVATLPGCDANRTGILRSSGRHQPTPGPTGLLPESRAYPQLVALTATGDPSAAFNLDDDDFAHPIVARRLRAAKPTRLVSTTAKNLPVTLAETVTDVVTKAGDPNVAAVVFTNSPATARAVHHQLSSADADVVVLTGQLRDPDANALRDRLLDPDSGAPSGAAVHRERPLIVVATQTLEVGADLDFDVCVSETAGVRALVQRWGRLNRLGDKPHAVGVLCHPADAKAGGLYGDEPDTVAARVTAALDSTGQVDLGPHSIAGVLGEPGDVPGRVGTLLPSHLWEAAKTSLPHPGEAPPEVFYDSIDDVDVSAAVLWRAHDLTAGESLWPPPMDAESVEVRLWELRDFVESHTTVLRIGNDGVTLEAIPPAPR